MEPSTATVVICYKRPVHLDKVLQRLREENIQNLYIFCDGPKSEEDRPAVEAVHKVIDKIDWTKPYVQKMPTNNGCSKMIPYAVTSALEDNDRAIILESDCVPKKYFFPYVYKCLDLYADNPKIMSIAGYCVPLPSDLLKDYPYDVFFYPVIGSDGWATWKRAWNHFDPDLPRLHRKLCENGIDIYQGGGAIANSTAHKLIDPKWDIWSINWVLSLYLQRAYCVYPIVAQTDNIGWDGSGVHCTSEAGDKYPNATADVELKRFPEALVLNSGLMNYKRQIFNCYEHERYDYRDCVNAKEIIL